MTLQAHISCPDLCKTSLVNEVRAQRLLDIPEQDGEAEGVRHFVKEGHGMMSFEGVHGADRAARVCSVYGSQRDAFRHSWTDSKSSDIGAAPMICRSAVSKSVQREKLTEMLGTVGGDHHG